MRFTGLVLSALVAMTAATVACGQSAGSNPRSDAAEIPSYELVSIRKTQDVNKKQDMEDEPDGLNAQATTLHRLVAEAYGFALGPFGEQWVYGGPAWVTTQRFDVLAKVDRSNVAKLDSLRKADTMMASVREIETRTPSYRMVMLQRVLEDRFHLKVHYEQKVMPIYEMAVVKGGLKMKAAHSADPEHGSASMSNGTLIGENLPMAFIPLILGLAPEVERPVVDKTGIVADYDFTIHWSPMGDENGNLGTLFTALQEQLGLKLNSSKGPVWVVVIDHAELPSEN